MRRFIKSAIGVTLLEVMLVLSVAAMIIVLSVRYYQSSSANNYANSMMTQIQFIASNANQVAQVATNGYAAVTQDNVQVLMPNENMTAPWGGSITISDVSVAGYKVSIANTPPDVCNIIKQKLVGKFSPQASCGTATATFTYSYAP